MRDGGSGGGGCGGEEERVGGARGCECLSE